MRAAQGGRRIYSHGRIKNYIKLAAPAVQAAAVVRDAGGTTEAAVIVVGLQVGFATIIRPTVAVAEAGLAPAKAKDGERPADRVDAAGHSAFAAVIGVVGRIGFAAVRCLSVTVGKAQLAGALPHGADFIVGAGVAASAAVLGVVVQIDFAPIFGIAVAIGVVRATAALRVAAHLALATSVAAISAMQRAGGRVSFATGGGFAIGLVWLAHADPVSAALAKLARLPAATTVFCIGGNVDFAPVFGGIVAVLRTCFAGLAR